MKSALANIGETEKSRQAAALEKAGHDGDRDFIAANMEGFIETLETLIKGLSPAPTAAADAAAAAANVAEDTAYLAEQLRIIEAACTHYDDSAVYAALDRLKEKPWKPETAAALDEIREMLFLHSDFEGAGGRIKRILEEIH